MKWILILVLTLNLLLASCFIDIYMEEVVVEDVNLNLETEGGDEHAMD